MKCTVRGTHSRSLARQKQLTARWWLSGASRRKSKRCARRYPSIALLSRLSAALQVRGFSHIKIDVGAPHEHEYGEESYDDAKDEYWKECKICNYRLSYEKM